MSKTKSQSVTFRHCFSDFLSIKLRITYGMVGMYEMKITERSAVIHIISLHFQRPEEASEVH